MIRIPFLLPVAVLAFLIVALSSAQAASLNGKYDFFGQSTLGGKHTGGHIKISGKKITLDVNSWSKTTIRLKKKIKGGRRGKANNYQSAVTAIIPAMPDLGQPDPVIFSGRVILSIYLGNGRVRYGKAVIALRPANDPSTTIDFKGRIQRGGPTFLQFLRAGITAPFKVPDDPRVITVGSRG